MRSAQHFCFARGRKFSSWGKKTYLTFDNTFQNNINYLDMLGEKCGEIFLFHW